MTKFPPKASVPRRHWPPADFRDAAGVPSTEAPCAFPPPRYGRGMNWWILLAGLNGFLGVAAGAVGAHALQNRLDQRALELFETAARYQLFHALALVGVAWLAEHGATVWPKLAGGSFIAGILLFSGTLYVIALTGSRAFAFAAPFGGLFLLAGWLCLVIAGIRGN